MPVYRLYADHPRGHGGTIHQQEQGGRRYTAEEADLLGAEAQNRATAVTGQIAQVAAQLGVVIEE